MMDTQCAAPDLNDLTGGYASGRLTPAELEAFELHLLECPACQDEVRTAAAVRGAARSGGRHVGRRAALIAIPLLAAAAVLLLLLPRNPYASLGRVDTAAPYKGIPTRAAEGALLVVDSALAAYGRGDLAQAEAQLTRAATDDAEPGVFFFLGVTRLLRGRAQNALAPLHGVLSRAPNPYVAEAHFYLAKAWLQLARPDSALAQLREIETDRTPLGRTAKELGIRVREAGR
ncbi:MAG: zf-HC2 domain-containing protein [Gemmatimonadetes bacterium]|nr:zf-HC2 domain-containing protein [Gemmatimonadota bacterium]